MHLPSRMTRHSQGRIGRLPLAVFASLAFSFFGTRQGLAQHEHPEPEPPPSHAEHVPAEPAHSASHERQMTGVLGISRTRTGSGTSWLPDSSPMYGVMGALGSGGFMLHGNVFVGYDWFGSDRGSDRFISVNSTMAMLWHPVGPGEIMGRLMLSAEPLTVGERGYPLILQTGETANGEPLHDRQHPHDLFMEVALVYTVALGRNVGLQFYAAPAGEPALGPTAFPHRISSISDPLAPLGHHWQDSTHIAFGVLTAAIFTRSFKLEGSWFNGREPDEERWDFDLKAPDSGSGRLSWNPNESLSLQASYGYLSSPEAIEPELSVHRVTSSITYNYRRSHEGNWATTFVFGENIPSDGPATPSFLLESNWNIDGHHVLYGRGEYVRKTDHDLVLDPSLEHRGFDTGMVALGYVFYTPSLGPIVPGIGVRGSLGIVDSALESVYGQRLPLGGMIFLQLRPHAMAM